MLGNVVWIYPHIPKIGRWIYPPVNGYIHLPLNRQVDTSTCIWIYPLGLGSMRWIYPHMEVDISTCPKIDRWIRPPVYGYIHLPLEI